MMFDILMLTRCLLARWLCDLRLQAAGSVPTVRTSRGHFLNWSDTPHTRLEKSPAYASGAGGDEERKEGCA